MLAGTWEPGIGWEVFFGAMVQQRSSTIFVAASTVLKHQNPMTRPMVFCKLQEFKTVKIAKLKSMKPVYKSDLWCATKHSKHFARHVFFSQQNRCSPNKLVPGQTGSPYRLQRLMPGPPWQFWLYIPFPFFVIRESLLCGLWPVGTW